MLRRFHRGARLAGAALVLTATASAQPSASSDPAVADASQPSRDECLNAHRSAQELKQTGKLLEAQKDLLVCSSGSCPGAVISDCGTWIADLEKMTPSMVFEIRVDGKEALDAQLFVDGERVEDWSHAVKVNPGRHTVRVELPPYPPHEEMVILAEGQRMRLIPVEFRSATSAADTPAPAPALPPPERERSRPTPTIVYPLVGLGVAGLASFGVFSLLGRSKQDRLEETCAPECTDTDLRVMKQMYLIGDISAGVGAAALLAGAVVYLTRPEESAEAGSAFSIGVGSLAPYGGSPDSFGVAARRSF